VLCTILELGLSLFCATHHLLSEVRLFKSRLFEVAEHVGSYNSKNDLISPFSAHTFLLLEMPVWRYLLYCLSLFYVETGVEDRRAVLCFELKESAKSLARANAHGRDSSDYKQNDVVNEI
jgi:hypothetical protein